MKKKSRKKEKKWIRKREKKGKNIKKREISRKIEESNKHEK